MKVSTSRTLLALSGATGLMFLGLIIMFAPGDSPVKAQDEKVSLVGKNFSPTQPEEQMESRPSRAVLVATPNSAAGPAQATTELAVDDGTFETGTGLSGGGTSWRVNRLTPTSYPATLTAVSIFFRTTSNLTVGAPLTIVFAANPSGGSNINGIQLRTVESTVRTLGQFNAYDVPALTISSGDIVVGYRITHPAGVFPFALDTTPPSRRRSYRSLDGATFNIIDDIPQTMPGNYGIRARLQGQTQSCPIVSGVNPASGAPGSQVAITGSNFTGVSSVRFTGGANATFTVNSDTQITTTVPQGAVTGPITISKPNCPDATTAVFTVPGGCAYSINPTSQNVTAGGGTANVMVTTQAGCAWVAVSNATWITITSGASGTGSGSVVYSVAANTGAARNGTITIAGQTFTVTQAGGSCTYSINPTFKSFAVEGGTDSVTVTTQAGCAWTATSNVEWITITGGASGNGSGAVNYSVASNAGNPPRSGTLTIAGRTFTVDQGGCSYTLSASSQTFSSSGGNGNVNMTAASGCAWTATSNADWITINSGSNGNGNGVVSFTVAVNTGAPRIGTITIAGRTFTVAQGSDQPTPYRGLWQGTTDQNLPLRFTVDNNDIVVNLEADVRISFFVPPNSQATCTYKLRGVAPAIINNGQFEVTLVSVDNIVAFQTSAQPIVRGTLSSATSASGQITSSTAGFIICGTSLTIGSLSVSSRTWNAQKQVQPGCHSATGVSPTSGAAGAQVTITGSNFTGVNAVRFTSNVNANFTVNSDTQITATVPQGAVTGPITISKPNCPDVTTAAFTVTGGTPSPGVWISQTSGTTNELRSVHFRSENEGWAAGANATLLRTTNGGGSWSAVNTGVDAARGFNSIHFLDNNVGWAGGTSAIARTLNGGANWATATLPATVIIAENVSYNSFSFLSSTSFWTGGGGTAFGDPASFISIHGMDASGNLRRDGSIVTVPSSALLDIHFPMEGGGPSGWMVGGNGAIRVYDPSAPGGTRSQSSGTQEQLNAIQMKLVSNNWNGWVVGANGTILKTANGGGAWARQTSGVTANLRDVFFVDANRGWAVGDGGVILTSNDGGATWTREQSGVTANLRGVFFVNATTGFAAGDNGTILKRAISTVGSLASVSAASFLGAELAAESIVAAFGQNLATTTQVAAGVPLPTELAGTTVKVRDSAGVARLAGVLNAASAERPAGLFFVAPAQVNYQIPPGTAAGAATVTITSGAGAVSAGTVNIASVAPGLFTANASGQGVAAAVVFRRRADGSESFEPVARFDQAQGRFVPVPIDLGPDTDQVFLILYGAGFRFRSSLSATAVTIGGVNSEVLFADAAPGFVGLDQANVRLSRSLIGRGEVDVVLTVDGRTANTVRIAVK